MRNHITNHGYEMQSKLAIPVSISEKQISVPTLYQEKSREEIFFKISRISSGLNVFHEGCHTDKQAKQCCYWFFQWSKKTLLQGK